MHSLVAFFPVAPSLAPWSHPRGNVGQVSRKSVSVVRPVPRRYRAFRFSRNPATPVHPIRCAQSPPPSSPPPPPPPPPSQPSQTSAKSPEEDLFVLEDDLLSAATGGDDPITSPAFLGRLQRPAAVLPTSLLSDILIALTIIAIAYGLAQTTGYLFSATPYASLTIDSSLHVLPWYAAQSLTRMVAAYFVSLVFSLAYAYIAYRVSFAANVLMLAIDVLQSIPLLSFLPGIVLGLIAIFPGARIGVELAAVLLLFTSMAWNMLLGFYQALCGIPRDLLDVSRTFRLSAWKRFWTLELPAGAIGLVWNSVISVAGGWFFLISIESFELGNRDFRLPGLGSYLALAAERADTTAILCGLVIVIAIIVAIDFLIWRPLIAWSAKFSYGAQSSPTRPRSTVLNALQRSPLVRSIHTTAVAPAWEAFVNFGSRNPFTGELSSSPPPTTKPPSPQPKRTEYNQRDKYMLSPSLVQLIRKALQALIPASTFVLLGGAVGIGVWKAWGIIGSLSSSAWVTILTGAAATFGRVLIALAFSLLWTVPAGVAIGRNAKLSALLQPIVQIAASVPATALFPFVLLFLAQLGGGLQIGSVALMMLGTMWYILFNVIAGAQAIPAELFDVDAVYNRKESAGATFRRWTGLILPGIFPYLITGIVTAVGGAWNASIVSEYVVFQGGVMKAHGLGAVISEAAASGDYAMLLAATVVMSLLVLLTNKFVWSPLYRLSETKYRI